MVEHKFKNHRYNDKKDFSNRDVSQRLSHNSMANVLQKTSDQIHLPPDTISAPYEIQLGTAAPDPRKMPDTEANLNTNQTPVLSPTPSKAHNIPNLQLQDSVNRIVFAENQPASQRNNGDDLRVEDSISASRGAPSTTSNRRNIGTG